MHGVNISDKKYNIIKENMWQRKQISGIYVQHKMEDRVVVKHEGI